MNTKENNLNKFFKTISMDNLQSILKQFNIDIFFDINIKYYNDFNNDIKTFLKLKNIQLHINKNDVYMNNHYISTFIIHNNFLYINDFYYILQYIKKYYKNNDYNFNNFYIIFNDHSYNVEFIEKYFKNEYNLIINIYFTMLSSMNRNKHIYLLKDKGDK